MAAKKRAGRPRNEQTRQAILQAAHEMLIESGFGQVTVEAVAARAGVGKPTIYRYWSNALELAMAAVMASDKPEPDARDGNGLVALRAQLHATVERFASPSGRQVTWLMAAAEPETELFKAFRNQIITRCRNDGRTLLEQAIESGQVRADAPLETTLDLLYGPVFYRLLAGHAPLDTAFADAVLDAVLRGIESR